eukprot:7797533-Heterocapsa_arctica.AAC.1
MTRKNRSLYTVRRAKESGTRKIPDYKGRVGQAVIDLGITLRAHTQASLNKGKRVADTVKVVRNNSISGTLGQR